MTAIAWGLTPVGEDPADLTLTPERTMERASPSANWLRAELFTHRKSRVMNISPEPRPIMAACDDAL
jgi:hypothetical protein